MLTSEQIKKEWKKDGGKYIPHPATWLRARGWEDEYTPATDDLPPYWTAKLATG